MNSLKYTRALFKVVVPFLDEHFPDGDFLFQDDGAPAHRSEHSTSWKRMRWGFRALGRRYWAPYSPDRNLIENCWGMMADEVGKSNPTTLPTLRKAILAAWDKVTPEYLDNLYSSQRPRDRAILAEKGGFTKW